MSLALFQNKRSWTRHEGTRLFSREKNQSFRLPFPIPSALYTTAIGISTVKFKRILCQYLLVKLSRTPESQAKFKMIHHRSKNLQQNPGCCITDQKSPVKSNKIQKNFTTGQKTPGKSRSLHFVSQKRIEQHIYVSFKGITSIHNAFFMLLPDIRGQNGQRHFLLPLLW